MVVEMLLHPDFATARELTICDFCGHNTDNTTDNARKTGTSADNPLE